MKTGQDIATSTPKVLDAGKGIHVKCLDGEVYIGEYILAARESVYLETNPSVHGDGRYCWLSL